jgi:hypothetical protein
MEMDLGEEKFHDPDYLRNSRSQSCTSARWSDGLISRFKFSKDLWKEAQAEGMPWAPLRLPEENLAEEHWSAPPDLPGRSTTKELGRTFR